MGFDHPQELLPPGRRVSGTSTYFRPERYAPVMLRLTCRCLPRCPQLRSRRRAHRHRHPQYNQPGAVSPSCSTTIKVLPRSRRRFMVAISLSSVALVQADARLVQHVQHTGQRAADLGGQAGYAGSPPDRMPRRETGQIAQPRSVKSPDVRALLCKKSAHRSSYLCVDLAFLDELQLLGHALSAEIGNVDAADRDGQAGGLSGGHGRQGTRHDQAISSLTHSLLVSRKRRSRLGTRPSNWL